MDGHCKRPTSFVKFKFVSLLAQYKEALHFIVLAHKNHILMGFALLYVVEIPLLPLKADSSMVQKCHHWPSPSPFSSVPPPPTIA